MSTEPVNSPIFLSIRKNVLYSNMISNVAIFQKTVCHGIGDKSGCKQKVRKPEFWVSFNAAQKLTLDFSCEYRFSTQFDFFLPNTSLQDSSKCWLGNRENPSNCWVCIIRVCIFKTVYRFCKVRSSDVRLPRMVAEIHMIASLMKKRLVPSLANFWKRSIDRVTLTATIAWMRKKLMSTNGWKQHRSKAKWTSRFVKLSVISSSIVSLNWIELNWILVPYCISSWHDSVFSSRSSGGFPRQTIFPLETIPRVWSFFRRNWRRAGKDFKTLRIGPNDHGYDNCFQVIKAKKVEHMLGA